MAVAAAATTGPGVDLLGDRVVVVELVVGIALGEEGVPACQRALRIGEIRVV